MSLQLISRNADLKKLQDEGYDVAVQGPYLILRDVPYLDTNRRLQRGVLVSELCLAGDVTTAPTPHTLYFAGSHPCDQNGAPLDLVADSEVRTLIDGLPTNFRFSRNTEGGYKDHHHKMTTYAAIVSGPAQVLYPDATPMTFPVVEEAEHESVFVYRDTATSRAGLTKISKRLEVGKVAIIGLGGTGSYILDFLAKAPIGEIHLYDGDLFLSHNAFRSPGAASLDELRSKPSKVEYLTAVYSKMRRGIVSHGYLDQANVETLRDMSTVFLALDKGEPKRMAVEKLKEFGVPFIDVGMGVYEVEGSRGLAGLLRVTTCTPEHPEASSRIDLSDGDGNDVYAQNIQLAELNALNAALAVMKWKRMVGFYLEGAHEHHAVYQLDGNIISNELLA